jgi:hypothetical protein
MIIAHRFTGGLAMETYMQSVKRTAESLITAESLTIDSKVSSVVRFTDSQEPTTSPSAEALGYSLSARFADEEKKIDSQEAAAIRYLFDAVWSFGDDSRKF